MQLSIVVRLATIAGCLAGALVCSGFAYAHARGAGWISPDTGGGTLYVANAGTSDSITLYDAGSTDVDPKLTGIIIQGVTNPTALAVDKNGSLYVANAATASVPASVEMYPKGAIAPAVTYTQNIVSPAGIAVDKKGDLFVANASGPAYIGPSVVKFPPGSTTPVKTMTDANASSVYALIADAKGDAYLAYSGYLCCPASAVDEYPVNQGRPVTLNITELLQGSNAVPFKGLALDNDGNVLGSASSEIAVYAPSSQPWPFVAPPIATFSMQRPQSAVALNRPNTRMFGLDAVHGQVIAYMYPSGSYITLYTRGIVGPTALAVSPAPLPAPPALQPPPPDDPRSVPKSIVYAGLDYLHVVAFSETGTRKRALDFHNGVDVPSGLAWDAARNLYVSNYDSNSITVYPFNQRKHSEKLTNGLASPIGVAVSSDGTIAAPLNDLSEIVVYLHGSSSQPIVLSASGALSVALDANDDVYFANASSVGEFVRGPSGYGSPIMLFSAVAPSALGDSLAIDSSGNILAPLADYPGVGVFPPGATSPLYVIGRGSIENPAYFSLDPSQKFVYILDAGAVKIFRYPTGTPFARFDSLGAYLGITLVPNY